MRKIGTVAVVAVLLGLLAASLWLAVRTWIFAQGAPMPASGYIAMALGVIFSLVVGVGLMALVFYSSRHGYDDISYDERPRSDGDHR
jgi:hypothetical protein